VLPRGLIVDGDRPPPREFASLLPEQDRYDVHFEDIPHWRSAP
jgi:hypothetical protein